jgi:very-short-patch-repair endonuclease
MTTKIPFDALWRALAPDAPLPESEYRFHPTRRWRFDFAWPAQRVAVEVDGGQWRAGGGRHNTDQDREKLNTAAAMGWRVLRFSHTALDTDPAGCVELVEAALIALREHGPQTSGQLRQALGVTRGAAEKTVKELREHGCIVAVGRAPTKGAAHIYALAEDQ